MRPGEWERERSRILVSTEVIEVAERQLLQGLVGDPLRFCRDILRFEPTEYQLEVVKLFEEKHFVALRWCRQSGKSLTVSALLLYYALTHPNCMIGVVGPSWRQTKLNIRRMTGLLKNVWNDQYFTPRKTAIRFTNGSAIEAYPNNPDTIRGPTLNCLPGYVNVTLSDGAQVPISKIKPGNEVLSFNPSTGHVESKKVLRTFLNPLADRRIVRSFTISGIWTVPKIIKSTP